MGEERESAVQSYSEEGKGSVQAEAVAQKRERGPKGGFAGVGAEKRYLALYRVKRKLPLLRSSLESMKRCLYCGSSRGRNRRRRPNSKIVRVKRKTNVGRED